MKIGFIAGTWDLLHPGHLVAIEFAQQNCDSLIIGLQSDPSIDRHEKNKPVETILERFIRLRSIIREKDVIVPYDTEHDLLNLLKSFSINIRFLDAEYEKKDFTGKDLDIEIDYLAREHDWSSSNLRKRIKIFA
ncbi:TagD [Caulobacter phage Cr30]|uniref:bifunctional heptose 7-phosphate kinase/heptose 1-phosphate adenyltransferase n=1 Tax=Caulobacter phage Cr30 TaxID=1357714 RepID=UPI0004A9B7C0|nr:bifunctional heptose 7-phosphate kinase/heptose 1-phosphate adenyltransferase [Caulobacter phage Cr30]AGS81165.1 TagD [Caulobacter phage Cr30]